MLIAAIAGQEASSASSRAGRPLAGNTTFNAQLRSYTIQRRRVHVKCDNSAKV